MAAIPERLPIGPMSLTCPHCKSKRGKDCTTTAGGFSAIHLERIEMAALADKMAVVRDSQRAPAPFNWKVGRAS